MYLLLRRLAKQRIRLRPRKRGRKETKLLCVYIYTIFFCSFVFFFKFFSSLNFVLFVIFFFSLTWMPIAPYCANYGWRLRHVTSEFRRLCYFFDIKNLILFPQNIDLVYI